VKQRWDINDASPPAAPVPAATTEEPVVQPMERSGVGPPATQPDPMGERLVSLNEMLEASMKMRKP